jgi:hypothetical protein
LAGEDPFLVRSTLQADALKAFNAALIDAVTEEQR